MPGQDMTPEEALAHGIKTSIGKQVAPLKDKLDAVDTKVAQVSSDMSALSHNVDQKMADLREGISQGVNGLNQEVNNRLNDIQTSLHSHIDQVGAQLLEGVRANAQAPLLGTPEKVKAFLEELEKE